MAINDQDSGRLLLDQEEAALAKKRSTVKAAASSLDALRKATDDCRAAFAGLKDAGFGHRDIVEAYNLTRDEAAALFPRRPRKRSDESGSDSTHDARSAVEERA